ncbi:hypothetical protein K438DRAFT_1771786 [Mycena galopus ATCC 62051]|nr:hypothetical protein K438DRAFT_1771786 [Mycena galopus ATCC 62051]
MPRLSARQARAREVLKTFLDHHTARVKAFLRRKNRAKRAFAQAGLTPEDAGMDWEPPADLLDTVSITMTSGASSSFSSDSESLTSDSTSTSSEDWSDVLGSHWRSSSSSSSATSDSTTTDDDTDSMPDLYPAGYPDSDDEDSDSDSTSDSMSDSGDDADDEDEWDLDGGENDVGKRRTNRPLNWVRHNLEEMYDHRYEMPRDTFPRGPAFLRHVLGSNNDFSGSGTRPVPPQHLESATHSH